jgi:hypothetical protein
VTILGRPPTLEQWRVWAATATRNYTDDPIGAKTLGRRINDARHSRLVEQYTPTRQQAEETAA